LFSHLLTAAVVTNRSVLEALCVNMLVIDWMWACIYTFDLHEKC